MTTARSGTRASVIGIAGGTCSGKTWAARELQGALGRDDACVVSLDSYYLTSTARDYDSPSSIDIDRAAADIRALATGEPTDIRVFASHVEAPSAQRVTSRPRYVIVEGLFVLSQRRIRDLIDYGVFIDTDEIVRITRRIARDVRTYHLPLATVLIYCASTVLPMHAMHVEPSRALADVVIPDAHSITSLVERILTVATRL